MQDNRLVVLQVLGGLAVGGAESRVMDITRNLNKDGVRYAFLLHSEGPDHYEEEAEALGCSIYRVPRFRFFNYFAYCKEMKVFFNAHPEIDIVQGHITSSAAIYLPIAKKAGVKATIAHARSAGVDKGIKGKLTTFLRRNLDKKTDYMWACSTEAAIAVYGKDNYDAGKVRVIPNAIDVDKFVPDENKKKIGQDIRKQYGLENKLVIGHVGSFRYAKNHEFLVRIFSVIAGLRDDARLLLVGEGGLMDNVKAQVKELGLENKVIFAGRQSKPQDYYHAMDMVIFPSRYEGLPGTIVESQASYIPALVSDAVTKDVGVTEFVKYMSLDESPENWANTALSYLQEIQGSEENVAAVLKEKGFDVKSQVGMLEKLYSDLLG